MFVWSTLYVYLWPKPLYRHAKRKHINPETLIFSKSLPIIFISYNWLPNSRCIELIFLNSNSFFCIPQCSMEENCLAPEAYRLRHESPNFSMESRRLLRFTTSIQNIGDADFRPFIPKTAWEWHACHMHYHSMEVSMIAFLHFYYTGSFIKKNFQIAVYSQN